MALRRPLSLLALLTALAASRASAQVDRTTATAALPSAASVDLFFENTELTEIVRAVAQRTGTAFAFDDRLRGRVTITAPRPVSPAEATQVLVAALRMAGFAVVSGADDVHQIVPVSDTAGRVDVSLSTPRAFVDHPVTTILPLHAAKAEELVPIVQPLLGANAVIQAFAPTNVLILSATEAQLQRVFLLARALDRAAERRLVLVRPRYRDASDLLPIVEATFPESRRAAEDLRVFADVHSNALVIEGSPELTRDATAFVRSVDLPIAGEGEIHVVRIRHADAETLAEVVQQATRPASGTVQPRGAAPGAEAATEALAGRELALSVDEPTNSLVIRTDPETFETVARLIAELDLDAPSVSVKATLLEIEDTGSLSVAVDTVLPFLRPATPSEGNGFVRLLNSGDPSLLGPDPADGPESFLLRFFKDPVTYTRIGADGETVTETVPSYAVDVKASATGGDTRLLAEPQILARSGEEQEIFVGNNIPIISATQTSATGATSTVSSTNPLTISQNVERQDVGVTLRVEPTVPTEGPVRLGLHLKFTALAAPFAGDVAAVGPTLVKQSVESTIYLDDGAGAVVGVRGQPTEEVQQTGTPFLMDVPGLGWLFRSQARQTVRKDMVLALQIQVIRSAEDLQLESIRRRIALERSLAGLESLPVSPQEAPFAVWVTTASTRAAAEAITAGLDLGMRRAQVVAWKGAPTQRFDVYVLGFDRYADAMKTCLEVRGQRFSPEVVALPGLSR